MIIAIQPLPKRKLHGVCTTEQPIFCRNEATEDVEQFGCAFDCGILNDFFKYKTIEDNGDWIIERVLCTYDPVFNTNWWWSSTVPIWPVTSKMYRKDGKETRLYRYLNGSREILDSGYPNPNDQFAYGETIYTAANREIDKLGFGTSEEHDELSRLSKFVVDAKDADFVLSNFTNIVKLVKEALDENMSYEDVDYNLSFFPLISGFEKDPLHDLFGFTLSATALKPLLSTEYSVSKTLPIQKDDKDIFLESEPLSDQERRLAEAIETGPFTSVKLVYRNDDKGVSVDADMQNIYTGIKASTGPIVSEFLRFVQERVAKSSKKITKLELQKTWSEEIVVRTEFDDKTTDESYCDLTAYSIASPLFVYNGTILV